MTTLTPNLRRVKGFKEPKETLPPRTFDESREDEVISLLEEHQRKRLEEDPLRELDEALMDRTTASLSRRQKITIVLGSNIIVKEVNEVLGLPPAALQE
jgi:hypothetical protein